MDVVTEICLKDKKPTMFMGVSKSMVVRLGWMGLGYGSVQVLRLVNNVILARLLAPPILGLMAVVNSIRTGVELLSDVGIMQNIISNSRGEEPDFYDTAWTIAGDQRTGPRRVLPDPSHCRWRTSSIIPNWP